MCGIYGRFERGGGVSARLDVDCAAVSTLRHRGPDDEGAWSGASTFLGMRRLSVIDLATGHQPIASEDGRITVVYNGEIYNYRELRDELAARGHRFATQSDTEVIVHGYEEWGDGILDRLNGMFAIALWDGHDRSLRLVRDRLGIKPLYYYDEGTRLIFGSEIKAILAHADVPREVSPTGLCNFLAYGHSVAPDTIYCGVRKLLPGHLLVADAAGVRVRAWWDPEPAADGTVSDDEWVHRVRELLDDSVARQMIADVPVGAFLSGGVDSSAIVALMRRHATGVVKTFSVGFAAGTAFNELPDARRVAAFLGTEHHELVVQSADLVSTLQTLAYHYDEPFADAAALPTYLVSRLARQHVTVVLTGEGGDELFGGYRRYWADRWVHAASGVLGTPPGALVAAAVHRLPRLRRAKTLVDAARLPDPATRYARLLRVFDDGLLRSLVDPHLSAAVAAYDAVAVYRRYWRGRDGDHMNRLMYVDMKTWLADTYLEKVDKASMAISLEARVPLLDHRLAELALRIPSRFKITRHDTKRVLKRAVADLLPPETVRKPKHGFAVPTDPWFRGELSRFTFDVLLDPHTLRRGWVRRDVVERLWREHQDQREVRDSQLWTLLSLELWARQYLDERKIA